MIEANSKKAGCLLELCSIFSIVENKTKCLKFSGNIKTGLISKNF